MIFNLLAGVVDNAQNGNNIPDNIPQEPTIQESFPFFMILEAIIILVMVVIVIAVYFSKRKEIKRLQEFIKSDITEEEQALINKYRKLNWRGKNLIDDNIKNLICDLELTNKVDKDDGN